MPPGQQLFDSAPQRRHEIDTWQAPNVALMVDALQKQQQRRYPVVIEGTWHSVFDDEPAPEDAVEMNVARITPAAHFYGPMQAVGYAGSAGSAALTLRDPQGNDVTALHRA